MREPVLTPQRCGGALLLFDQTPEESGRGLVSLCLLSLPSERDSGYPVWSFRLDDLTREDLQILRTMTARVEVILDRRADRPVRLPPAHDPFRDQFGHHAEEP